MNKLYVLIIITLLLAGCSKKTPAGETPIQEAESSMQMDWVSEKDESRRALREESAHIESEPPKGESTAETSPPVESHPYGNALKDQENPVADRAGTADDAPPRTQSHASSSPAMIEREELQAPSPYLEDVEKGIIALINQRRAELELQQLTYDKDLQKASRIRSREMYQNKYFAHGRPNGDGWQTVLQKDVPVAYIIAGENLANVEHNLSGQADPAYDAQYWFDTWVNSAGHYENIVREDYTHIGAGVIYEHKDGMVNSYATTIFASF